MTIEKVIINESRWAFAFSSQEREYLQTLTNRVNLLNDKILMKTETVEEKMEYYALKWVLKQIGGVTEDELQKTPRPKIVKKKVAQ